MAVDGCLPAQPSQQGAHRVLHGRAGWLAVGVVALAVSACSPTPSDKEATITSRQTTKTDPIDLKKLDCPSGSVKAVVQLVRTVLIEEMNNENVPAAKIDSLEVVCIGQKSGQDVVLEIKSYTISSPGKQPDIFMLGPDNAKGVDQLEAALGPGGFTAVAGVGDNAASVVETTDSRRTVTLYVQSGDVAFHVSMQVGISDALAQKQEKKIATAVLANLATTSQTTTTSATRDTFGAYINGDYAAGLLTTDQLTTAFGRPMLALSANGGRPGYAPGIDISNASTFAKDGSAQLDLRIFRATSADAAKTYLSTMIAFAKETPDPQFAGLGDATHNDSSGLYVLSGREIANIRVQRLANGDALKVEKAIAALIAPKLQH
jgi:hypothetical protein